MDVHVVDLGALVLDVLDVRRRPSLACPWRSQRPLGA